MIVFPIEIAFRNLDHSAFVEADVRDKIGSLERFYERIHYIRVIVEAEHRKGHKGHLYRVHVTIGVPGQDIVVSRTGPHDHAHEDVYVAVRDSFNAATRMLEDHARKLRGQTKLHEAPLLASVARIFPNDGYGFVATADGKEVYFHKNSVAEGGFDALKAGTNVRLVVAEGEGRDGPQASAVIPLGEAH